MAFAETLADLNEWHFFKEFVYSQNTFRPTPQQEVELADNVLWLGDLLVVFQLKERNPGANTGEDAERKWFQRKVLNQATHQIRDTFRYLEEQRSIALTNHRGHERQLEFNSINQFHKLVVYLPGTALPQDCLDIRFHVSRTAGLIHIIPAHDYLGIVRTLLTPAELADYLDFRSELIKRWNDRVTGVPEPAIVGQYLHGDASVPPGLDHLPYLQSLDQQVDEWDLSGIVSSFPDRVTTDNAPTDYYPIITELASLKRNELREFKARFQLSIEKSRVDEFTRPYRIAIPRTGCGFVFIPLTKDMFEHRRTALENFTHALKYEQRLQKCIGVAIGNHQSDGWFHAEWCYIDCEWVQDAEMDKLLTENNPFRPAKMKELPRYSQKKSGA
jgi:hypothetical protein